MTLIAHYRLDGNADDAFGKFNGVASNVTWAAGKLGQAASFDGGNSYVGLSPAPVVGDRDFSLAFWANPSSTNTGCFYCTRTVLGEGLSLFWLSGQLRFDLGNQWSTGAALPLNAWSHVVVGAKSGTKFIYVNGVSMGSRYFGSATSVNPNLASVGASQVGGTGYGNFFPGLLDDVRIYDHALSVREVRDLAMGLAVHYPMLDFQEPTENLLSVRLDTAPDLHGKSTKTYLGNGEYRFVNNGTGNSNIRLRCPLDRLVNGATYACQVKFKDNTGYVVIDWCDVGIAGLPSSSAAEGVLYGTAAKATYDATYNFLDITIGSGTSVTLYEAQVEHKPHVTPYTDSIRSARVVDTSGQGADAPLALTTSPKWIEESPTGRGSYLFTNDATKRIDRPLVDLGSTLTYSCWAKQDSTEGTALKFIVSSGRNYQTYGVNVLSQSGDIRVMYGGGPQGNESLSSGVSVVGVWRHIVFTHDMANGARLYVDGVLTATGPARTIDYSEANNRTVIGKMAHGYTSTVHYFPFSGPISDVRLYASALTAEQVKELYQQRASLDDQGNFYAQMINERGATKFQVTKGGQLSSQVSEVGITDGLVAYYPLNKDAKDYSGNGLHGVVVGASPVGRGYFFDGVDDYIYVGSHTLGSSWSINTVYKASSFSKYTNLFTAENQSTFALKVGTDGRFYVHTSTSGSKTVVAPLSASVEYHLVATCESGVLCLYVNGALALSTPFTVSIPTSNFYVGKLGVAEFSHGVQSNLKVFNRALTAQEIAVEYKRTGPTKMTQHQGVTYIQGEFKEV